LNKENLKPNLSQVSEPAITKEESDELDLDYENLIEQMSFISLWFNQII